MLEGGASSFSKMTEHGWNLCRWELAGSCHTCCEGSHRWQLPHSGGIARQCSFLSGAGSSTMCMILLGRYSCWGSWDAIRDDRKAFGSWSMCSCFESDLWQLSSSGKHEAGSPAVVGFSVLCSVPLADINAGMPLVGFTRDSRTCALTATDDQLDSAECFCTAARTFAERFNSSWDATRIKEAI